VAAASASTVMTVLFAIQPSVAETAKEKHTPKCTCMIETP
jgi:hypothetical protein